MVDNDVIKRTIHDKTFTKVTTIDTKVLTGCKSCLQNTILLRQTNLEKNILKMSMENTFCP